MQWLFFSFLQRFDRDCFLWIPKKQKSKSGSGDQSTFFFGNSNLAVCFCLSAWSSLPFKKECSYLPKQKIPTKKKGKGKWFLICFTFFSGLINITPLYLIPKMNSVPLIFHPQMFLHLLFLQDQTPPRPSSRYECMMIGFGLFLWFFRFGVSNGC